MRIRAKLEPTYLLLICGFISQTFLSVSLSTVHDLRTLPFFPLFNVPSSISIKRCVASGGECVAHVCHIHGICLTSGIRCYKIQHAAGIRCCKIQHAAFDVACKITRCMTLALLVQHQRVCNARFCLWHQHDMSRRGLRCCVFQITFALVFFSRISTTYHDGAIFLLR